MGAETRIIAGVTAGYLLGRTKKMRLALSLAGLLAGKQITTDPKELAKQLAEMADKNPRVAELKGEVTGEMLQAAQAAATAILTQRMNTLSDSLRDRSETLRGLAEEAEQIEGELVEPADDSEDEQPAPEDADTEDEEPAPEDAEEDAEAEDEQTETSSSRQESPRSSEGARERAPAKKSAGSSSAKKAPAKKSASSSATEKAPAKRAPAKKSTAKRASATKSGSSSQSRSRGGRSSGSGNGRRRSSTTNS